MSQYCIYQLPVEKEYTFRDWEEVKGRFHFSDYKQVYKGELVDSVQYGEKITPCNKDDRSVLEDLYVKFNVKYLFACKTVSSKLADFSDDELVIELINRGYKVSK